HSMGFAQRLSEDITRQGRNRELIMTALLEKALKAANSGVSPKKRYENYIGGKWVPPVKGDYFDNLSPVTGKVWCEAPRSTREDIEQALDAAHAAKDAWGKTPIAARAVILNKIADRMEQHLA